MKLFGIPLVNDGWWGRDKFFHWLLHFGGTLYFGFLMPMWAFGRTHWLLIASAGVLSEGFGILYELHDHYRGCGFSYTDLIWNNKGMVEAILVGIFVLLRIWGI